LAFVVTLQKCGELVLSQSETIADTLLRTFASNKNVISTDAMSIHRELVQQLSALPSLGSLTFFDHLEKLRQRSTPSPSGHMRAHRHRDKVRPLALVTGASGGIGAALAGELARDRHDLVLVARGAPGLQLVADQLQSQYGTTSIVVAADLSQPAAANQLFQRICEREGS
jgi:FlaA1/EpsC-like NDP-sugar epimerase